MWTKQQIPDAHLTRCRGCHRLICISENEHVKTSMLHAHNDQDIQGYKWHMVLCQEKHGTRTAERLRLNKWL